MALMAVPVAAKQDRYEAGQVWSYKTRPQDVGSLIRIHRIEPFGPKGSTALVYHVSIIGLSLGGQPQSIVGHVPVSRETLDNSVVEIVRTDRQFPEPQSVEEGIEIWRTDEGGIFTILLAEIVNVIEQAQSGSPESPAQSSSSIS